MVRASDEQGTSPGKDVLARLFERFAPCVVLIDEAVAYLRQFEPGRSYAGGTFDSNLSFFQALTEAATGVPRAMVLGSLPESVMEVGDRLGQRALDSLEKYFGRVEPSESPSARARPSRSSGGASSSPCRTPPRGTPPARPSPTTTW